MVNDKRMWDFFQNNEKENSGGERNLRKQLGFSYPRQNSFFNNVKKYIPLKTGDKILEIGFWDWYLLNKLASNGYDVIWQDLSDINIEQTKKQRKNDKIKFKLGDDSWKILVDDESLDWFIASEVLEHMSDEELQTCVSEIYRCLKSEWYAFISFPCRENLDNRTCICPECWAVFHKVWHKQRRDREKIDKVFKKFKIIKIRERFYRYPGNNKIEMICWLLMYYIRTFVNLFIDLENKTYFLILQK